MTRATELMVASRWVAPPSGSPAPATRKALADVGLSIDGRLPAREGATVFAGEAEIGRVTSGGFSPTLGHPIAMAFVDREAAEPGTDLIVDVRGRPEAVDVVRLPFYRRST